MDLQSRGAFVLVLWLLGAGVAVILSLVSVMAASNGKMSALALVPFAWTIALLAGAVRYVGVFFAPKEPAV